MALDQGNEAVVVLAEDLRRALPLAGWPQEALQRLADASRMRWYDNGTVISRLFEPPTHLWIVMEGCVEMSRSTEDGQRYIVDLMAPPQISGLVPALDGRANMFDTIVRGRSRLVAIPREALLAEMAADASVALRVIQVMCVRTRIDNDRSWTGAVDPPAARVAKTILYMGRRPGLLDQAGDQLPMQIVYEDIADFLGLSRSAVVRVGRELIAAGAVRKSYRGIVIADVDKLVAIAEQRSAFNPWARQYLFGAPRG